MEGKEVLLKGSLLYLGLDPPPSLLRKERVIHFPMIATQARGAKEGEVAKAFERLEEATHAVFTSKVAVALFFQKIQELNLEQRFMESCKNSKLVLFAIGERTAQSFLERGLSVAIAPVATQEGLIELFEEVALSLERGALIFYPHSSLARELLLHYFQKKQLETVAFTLYDTLLQLHTEQIWHWQEVETICFTSPSTVVAFQKRYGKIPSGKRVVSIGPITKEVIVRKLDYKERVVMLEENE